MNLPSRPRRNRRTPAMRGLARETRLSPEQLAYPMFVHGGTDDVPIDSMPGQYRWSIDGLVRQIGQVTDLGVDKIALFPKIESKLKTEDGGEAANDRGLVPRALQAIKAAHPEVCLITDVALDPYSSDGHDGIVSEAGVVMNDASVELLSAQALAQARAGADIVAPSDMMDGRVGAIRTALDQAGFTDVAIVAYTAKYASSYYGPFRGALDSAPIRGGESDAGHGQFAGQSAEHSKPIPPDKKTYQMDPANRREALRELALDEAEGADAVMVKPAGPYLDVIAQFARHTRLPVAAYQVSGEYAMIKAAAAAGYIDEPAVVLESLTAIARAGAGLILTYHAPDAARWL